MIETSNVSKTGCNGFAAVKRPDLHVNEDAAVPIVCFSLAPFCTRGKKKDYSLPGYLQIQKMRYHQM